MPDIEINLVAPSTLRIDESLALPACDLTGLREDVRQRGIVVPLLVTRDDLLLDGHRRLTVARELDLPVVPVLRLALDGAGGWAATLGRAVNLHRRHLTEAQRVALGTSLERVERVAAKERQGERKPNHPDPRAPDFSADCDRATAHVAAAIGVSRGTYERARAVLAAPEVAPAVKERLLAGRISIAGAYKDLQRTRRQAATTTAAEELRELPESIRMEMMRMQDLLPTLSNLDAIITDPPYGREFVPLYADLARCAARALGPNGRLAVMCGQSYLPEGLASMCEHLPYRWTMAYLTPGGQTAQLWDRKINTFWKPVLLFGLAGGRWSAGVVRSDAKANGKRI